MKEYQQNEIKELIFKLCASPEFGSKKYVYSQFDSTVGIRTLQNPHSIGVAPLHIFEENKTTGFQWIQMKVPAI